MPRGCWRRQVAMSHLNWLRAMDFAPWLDFVTDPLHGSIGPGRQREPDRVEVCHLRAGDGTRPPAALGVAAEVAMPAVAARLLIDEVADVNDVAVASGLLREFLESPRPHRG